MARVVSASLLAFQPHSPSRRAGWGLTQTVELRECAPAPGKERVLYAGLPEYEAYQDRSVNGIPYHPEVIDWFRRKTDELGVEHRLGD